MRSALNLLAGWVACDEETYRQAWHTFGGSVCTHPDVAAFLAGRKGIRLRYSCKYRGGQVIAAVCHHASRLSLSDRRYPFVFDDILFPIDPQARCLLPFHSQRISPRLRHNVTNALYQPVLKKKLALVKPHFSPASERKRNGELKRFLQRGGSIVPISAFSDQEISDIYIKLFKARWGESLRCYSQEALLDTLAHLRPLLAGNVLLFNQQPCACDLLFMAESARWCYFDDINGGYDPARSDFSPGSLLLWQNIVTARQRCAATGKEMIFSLGAWLRHWHYKRQWCEIHTSGRLL